METVSLKLDSALAKAIEKEMKAAHYSTKTEFFREAAREKLAKLQKERAKEKAWEKLFAMRGILKGKGKPGGFEEWRTNVFSKQFEKELEEEFGPKH